jgi:hypothetical protein
VKEGGHYASNLPSQKIIVAKCKEVRNGLSHSTSLAEYSHQKYGLKMIVFVAVDNDDDDDDDGCGYFGVGVGDGAKYDPRLIIQ